MKQLLLDIAPAPAPSLDNFVVGRNTELVNALRTLPQGEPDKRALYIWGAPGSGRSHLLTAAAAHFHALGLQPEACCITDDIDRLDDTVQLALFNRFNGLREAGGVFLAAGPCPPMQLGIREDLRTRLGWGLVYQVHALNDEEKLEALQRHAAERGFHLSQDVAEYLLRQVRRDLPTLMSLLDALDAWSLAEKRPVTLPLLRQVLQLALFDDAS